MASTNKLAQIKDMWTAFSSKQRLLLIGGALLTAAVLAGFANLIGKPDYKPLFTNMEPSDAQSLASRLAAKKIPYELSADQKSISVPADRLDESRLQIASEGMPHSGRLGFELFDKMNWGQTEFDEKVNYQRALEGELERTIRMLHGVEDARVHLVMPADSVFLDRERTSKASVILKLSSGSLSDDTEMSIARLVSGAVDKLSPEDVTVVDADTNRRLGTAGRGHTAADGGLDQKLTAALAETMTPVVGAGHLRATVNVEYDPSSSEENQETYDPKSAVAVSLQKSEEQTSNGVTGGVPGTSSNVPGSGQKEPQGEDATQSSKTESSTFVVNKVIRHTLQPAGRIRRISAALVVDDVTETKEESGKRTVATRKRTPEELKEIQALAFSAIGLDSSRGDSLVVQNLSFPSEEGEKLSPPTPMQRVTTLVNDYSIPIRYLSLLMLFLLVYWLLLRPIKRQASTAFKELSVRSAAAGNPALAGGRGELTGGAASEASGAQELALVLKRQVERAKAEPASASRVIQAWLREEA